MSVCPATLAHMTATADFTAPQRCIDWCRAQDSARMVLDETVTVDLDKWNRTLHELGVDTVVRGRDADGRPTGVGLAHLQRADLTPTSALIDPADPDRSLVYQCAAWLSGHRVRRPSNPVPRLPHRAAGKPGSPGAMVDVFLRACATDHGGLIAGDGGWLARPGIGMKLRATVMWAHQARTVGGAQARLVDQFGVNSLIRHGWLGTPVVSAFTPRRYDSYVRAVQDWARQAGTDPDLVEMWLVREWQLRLSRAQGRPRDHDVLF